MTPLKPLIIGKHIIDAPLCLAPLSGVTDAPFRRLVSSFGVGYVVSEMIPSDDLVNQEEEARLRFEGDGLKLHIVQLAGCSPHIMAEGARVAQSSGAHIIDINMGCPAKRVTGGYAGSALMRDEVLALKIIEATVKAATVPVTLKMRLGWDDASINAPFLAREAQNLGVQLITVHGRTRQQFYKGIANWAKIADVKEQLTIPLIVNGDIVDFASAKTALKQSGADGFMVGRGAQGRPWILKELWANFNGKQFQIPSVNQQYMLISGLYEAHIAHYGAKIGVRHARKHLGWALEAASQNAQWLSAWRGLILTLETPELVHLALKEAYDTLELEQAA
jgi:tRNA-dihydrouridine synthase B